jgi:hypothetical protein
VWVDPLTIDVGVRIGIRANRPEVRDALARVFADWLVDDATAPVNFSLRLSEDPRRAHILYWGGCVAARSFDPARMIEALVRHTAINQQLPDGLIAVRSLACVSEGRGAVLVPAPLQDDLLARDRRLRADGMLPTDLPWSWLDVEAGAVVVPSLAGVDDAALARAAALGATGRTERSAARGAHPLERWLFIDYTGESGPLSRASATRAACMQVTGGVDGLDPTLVQRLGVMFARVRGLAMELGFPGSIVRSIRSQGVETVP